MTTGAHRGFKLSGLGIARCLNGTVNSSSADAHNIIVVSFIFLSLPLAELSLRPDPTRGLRPIKNRTGHPGQKAMQKLFRNK